MGFKLGGARETIAQQGSLKKKLSFKTDDASIPGNPVIRKTLGPNILGEANMDGSIFISNKIQPGSSEENQVLLHEMRHATDMRIGKLAYSDDYIMYNGEKFERKDINGVDSILVDGKWKEAGDTGFPWEVDANNGSNGDI